MHIKKNKTKKKSLRERGGITYKYIPKKYHYNWFRIYHKILTIRFLNDVFL